MDDGSLLEFLWRLVQEVPRIVKLLSDHLQERLERIREARRAEGRAEANEVWEQWLDEQGIDVPPPPNLSRNGDGGR